MHVSEFQKWEVFLRKYNPIPWLEFKDVSKNLEWSDIAKMYGVNDGE